jgi:undecaprenyl-diphosphatase
MSVPWGFGSLDRVAFALINQAWANPVFDRVLPALTDLHKIPWVAWGVAPAVVGSWLYKGRRRALQVLLVAALAVGAADMVAYRFIKPWAARPRPSHAGIGAVLRVGSPGGAYGFPSNHAANAGAAASVLAVAYPPLSGAFWFGAAVVAYSRVYVGVHYPGDVLAGLLLGALLGTPWAWLMLGGAAGAGKKKKKR